MILFSPIYEKNAIYRPVSWYTFFNSSNLAYCKVTTFVNNNPVSTNFIQPIFSTPTNPQKIFLFDAQKILQLYIGIRANDKSTIFSNNLVQNYQTLNTEQGAYVRVLFEYYNNVNGLPELVESEESTEIFCVNSCVQNGESYDLSPYLLSLGSLDKKPLTRRPVGDLLFGNRLNCTTITDKQTFNITYFPDDFTNCARLVFSDQNGQFIESAFLQLDPAILDFSRTVGLGFNQLVGANFFTTTPNLNNQDIKYYTISLGNYNGSTFSAETINYSMELSRCNKGLEINWLNDLGGFESFIFNRSVQEEETAKGAFSRKPLKVNFSYRASENTTYDNGRFKFNNLETKRSFKVVSKDLNDQEAQWLKTLIYSTEVYIIEGGELVSVQVEDSNFVTSDLNNFATILELTITASVDPFAQIR